MAIPNVDERHPATQGLLKHFAFDHLPADLAGVSRGFHDLAHALLPLVEDGPELTAGLRKLLEAKDCAVRAALEGRR